MHRVPAQHRLGDREAALRIARLSFLALIAGNVCLAFGPVMVRIADVGPIASGFWRLAIAAPMLVALAGWSGHPVTRIPRRMWWWLGAAAWFFAADLAAWHVGILLTRLANAALFANITSFTFSAYGFIVARRLPHRHQAAAILLALIGAALLLGRSFELSADHLAGDMLCIAAGLFYTGYLVIVDRARGTIPPLPVLAVSTLLGVLPLLALALLAGERVWPGDWTPLIALAIGSQVLGQGLIVFALAHQPPLIVGLALLVQPVMAATIGWIGYGERLGALDLTGIVVIAAALILVRRPGPAAAPLPPTAESA